MVLPAPGDLVGLPAPGAFTRAAVEAAEGVLFLRPDGSGTGLVPTLTAHGSPFDGTVTTVSWASYDVVAPVADPGPFLHDAEHDLRRGVVEVAGVLRDLDVARWRPELADALSDLRRQVRQGIDDDELPGSYPARARDLLVRARQLGAVVSLALRGHRRGARHPGGRRAGAGAALAGDARPPGAGRGVQLLRPGVSVLVTVTGPDAPGVTAALMDVLAACDARVLDVEQVVVHGRLLLGVEVEGDGPAAPVTAALRTAAGRLGVEVEVTPLDDAVAAGPSLRHHVVLLARDLRPDALAAVARRVAGCGANIERVLRLSTRPAQSYELLVSGGDTARLRSELAAEAVQQQIDVAVERASLFRRARRLVVMDVDSTLVQGEVIEMLAAQAGCEAEVARVTAAAMAGELDFEASLRARLALLEGLPVSAVDAVRAQVRLTPGARTLVRTLKRLGYAVGVVSGGFTAVTDDLVALLGLDHARANVLEVVDGRLTGRVVGPVVDRAGKARALREFAASEGLAMAQTVAVGDGANDLDMIEAAGLGIAFNAKPAVREAADAAISLPFLDAVLFLLGVTREEVEQADADLAGGGAC